MCVWGSIYGKMATDTRRTLTTRTAGASASSSPSLSSQPSGGGAAAAASDASGFLSADPPAVPTVNGVTRKPARDPEIVVLVVPVERARVFSKRCAARVPGAGGPWQLKQIRTPNIYGEMRKIRLKSLRKL